MANYRAWQPAQAITLGSYMEPSGAPNYGFECTTAGTTGQVEPPWSTIVAAAATITDGTVVWTSRAASIITWTAVPLFKNHVTDQPGVGIQPAWSTSIGGYTVTGSGSDGVRYTTRTPAITDSKCPHNKLAISMSQKVFSPDKDVLRYSATNLPKNWSQQDDAGFLPTGMHAPKTPEVTALGEYRGRLCVFTASNLQVWTTDPDPAEQSLFDNIDGVGTIFDKCITSVSGDLFFLTLLGVRTLSIAAGAMNLQAGDIGTGIDDTVQAFLTIYAEPIAFYYPASGQYWLVLGNEAYVYSQSKLGRVGAWSRFVFPWTIVAATTLSGELYLRTNTDLLVRVDEALTTDYTAALAVGIQGTIEWPFLDLENPGVTKFLQTVDVVADGTFTVQVAYDQNNSANATPAYASGPDTLPGTPIAIPVAAPSMSIKLVFPTTGTPAIGQEWRLYAVQLTVEDQKGQP